MTDDDEQRAHQALSLLELSASSHDDTEQRIVDLCRRALTPLGPVAAVCVPPRFVCLARISLDRLQARDIRVVAQVNFPYGKPNAETAADETRAALFSGADEIEVVYPFRSLLSGKAGVGAQLVTACRAECGKRAELTVTLETGELRDSQLIRCAASEAIEAGAHFIKTCTDRLVTPLNAQAARVVLESIAETGGQVGFKATGGLRTLDDAETFMSLAANRFGHRWLSPARVRLGGTVLLDALLARLGVLAPAASDRGGY